MDILDNPPRVNQYQSWREFMGIEGLERENLELKFDVIDKKWDEAYALFTKIYNEFIESEDFKKWIAIQTEWEKTESYKKVKVTGDGDYPRSIDTYYSYGYCETEEERKLFRDYDNMRVYMIFQSPARHKYNMKMQLLRSYLGLQATEYVDKGIPVEWYHNEYMRPSI